MTLNNNLRDPWAQGLSAQNGSLAEFKALLLNLDPAVRDIAETAFFLGARSNEKPKQEIVILVHGIRTHAEWQERLRDILSERDIKCVPIGYGFFDVIRFLCPIGTRRSPQLRIERELRSVREKYPNSNISVVAHSFGTYLISKILDDATDISINRLILCGSIISESYRWDKVRSRVQLVVNDVGCRDIWPILAKQASIGYGTSGVFGFKTVDVRDRFHSCRHSDFFLNPHMEKYWLPFLENGQIIGSAEDSNRKPNWFLSFLAWLPLKWMLLAAAFFFTPLEWAAALIK